LHWQADVKIAFGWLKAALLAPLRPGSRVIVVSSAQRFIAGYAAEESRRAGLGLTVTAVLPAMTPLGAVGQAGVRAYAARSGQTKEQFLAGLGEPLTPERVRLTALPQAWSRPAA
jgi:hypothetical protein